MTTPTTGTGASAKVMRAVYLLRVSDQKQMYTASDIDPEGNSVPTQRFWCDAKLSELGAIKVGEYIEPGFSGQFMDKRPIFKKLIRRIVEDGDVDCVIIYMRSRIFRSNYVEAAIVKHQLRTLGVKLVSAKENFGDGYMGEAMEAVTDVFNWVQVQMSGDDISAKMLNKARNGGTNGRAKLGYLNTRISVDGHPVNTITVDSDRAPLVIQAFELMASGTCPNTETLRTTLTDAGLRMPGTGKPVSIQTIQKLLRDKYYTGLVIYKGMEYPGRHTPLITPELFDRVQRILDTHSGTGTRQRVHHHYLKGTIWCARCTQRFVVQRAKNRHDPDGEYYYFFCTGRRDHICDQPYLPVEAVEKAVQAHWGDPTAMWMDPDLRARVNDAITSARDSRDDLSTELRQQHTVRLAKLDDKESYLLDLAAENDWPKDTLRAKVAAIRDERHRIHDQLDHASHHLDTGIAIFTRVLDLLDKPHELYATGDDTVRKLLNRTFFTKLYIDGHKTTVTSHQLREPFNTLHAHRQAPTRPASHPTQRPANRTNSTTRSKKNPQPMQARGSTSDVMVELRGFDPNGASFS